MQPLRTVAQWLAYQEQLHPKAIALGLERVGRVADTLGLRIAPPLTLTVGGTNGKGSTTTLLAGIYRAAGYRVGAYTSPHLHRYHERIAIDGVPVDDAALCAAFEAVEAARAGETLTYFEFGTLAALWLFRAAKVEVQVLEVGLGGRLDAVNVLDADAALITNIGLDHQDWLGDTRDAIGREKAGILRPGRPAVIGDAAPPQGLLDAARACGARLIRVDQGDYAIAPAEAGWRWCCGSEASPPLPEPALAGAHQRANAAAAIALVRAREATRPVPWQAVATALRALRLPGRLEWRGRFLLDVAHNAESAQVLADYLAATRPGAPVLWLAGVLADKPVEAMVAALRGAVTRAVTLDLEGPRALPAAALAARLTAAGLPAVPGGSPAQALARASAEWPPAGLVLVSGSFLTVAALAPLIADPASSSAP